MEQGMSRRLGHLKARKAVDRLEDCLRGSDDDVRIGAAARIAATVALDAHEHVALGVDPFRNALHRKLGKFILDANEGIDRVAKLMAQDGTRRVLVTKDGKLLGVIRVQTILARMRDYIDSISAQIARAQLPIF